jgi:hypothetical protein
MSDKPPKTDRERLENILVGLSDVDEDELPSLEQVEKDAKAHGIDFDKWAEEIRKKAVAQLAREEQARVAGLERSRNENLTRIAARPRPTGTFEEKRARMRELITHVRTEEMSAHFQKLENVTESELDELIVALEDQLERDKKPHE